MEKVFFLKMHIKRNRTERNPKNLKNFFSANIVLPMIFVVCQREVLSTRTEEKRVCWSRRKILSLQYCPLKTCHELSMREESDKMKRTHLRYPLCLRYPLQVVNGKVRTLRVGQQRANLRYKTREEVSKKRHHLS